MKKLILMVFIILFSFVSYSQEASFEKAECLFIYNFTRYIEWNNVNTEFVIGVLDDYSVYNELIVYTSNKYVKSYKITIKKINSIDEIQNIQILIIGRKSRSKCEEIKKIADNSQILTINTGDDNITDYSCIGFRMVDDKMKFTLHKKNVISAKLQMLASLEKMGIVLE
jgi:hypothetical protein